MDSLFCLRLITVLSVMILFVGTYVFVYTIRSTGRLFLSTFTGAMVILTYTFVQLCLARIMRADGELGPGKEFSSFFDMIPVGAVVVIFLAIPSIYTVIIHNIRGYRKKHITPSAVKLGLDEIPDGLLYYNEYGIIRFINPAMSNLAELITGRQVLNGNDLYEGLCKGVLKDGVVRISAGDRPVIELENGRIYSFEKKEKLLKNEPIRELISFDVTDEYRLSARLKDNQKKLAEQRERLLTLGESITEYTIEKEILDAKVRIHDDFGKGLTASRYYIEQGKGTPEELLKLWNTNIRLLENEEKPKKRDDYETVLKASGDVGVGIVLHGSLPREDDNKKIIAAAIRECVTNTFRHAKGDTVYINTTQDETEYHVTFRNNGNAPEGRIAETGGLKNLRNLVERSGGSMEVKSEPEFVLTISLFIRGNENV